MVSMPRRLASSKARSRLAELPLVDSPTAMSFRPPNAASCRANTTSTPTSLHSAVTTEVSLASPNAGSGGAVLPSMGPGFRNSVASCWASVALPPLPKANSRPPAPNLAAACARALGDPRPVPRADGAAQLADLRRLGHGRGAHLVEHGGQVAGVGVQERIQRFHRVAHDPALAAPTTAMASLACTRIVSPTPARHQRHADRLLARAGVDHGHLVLQQPQHP